MDGDLCSNHLPHKARTNSSSKPVWMFPSKIVIIRNCRCRNRALLSQIPTFSKWRVLYEVIKSRYWFW